MAKQSFLLTRFNVAKCDEDWLDIRLKLFEKFCVPSVLNQVYKDFTWLIFFDPRTPFRYVDRILNCGFKDVVPLVVDEKSNNFFVNSGNEVTKVAAEAAEINIATSWQKPNNTTNPETVLTTTLEHAELKREQIHAFGPDWRIEVCAGSHFGPHLTLNSNHPVPSLDRFPFLDCI